MRIIYTPPKNERRETGTKKAGELLFSGIGITLFTKYSVHIYIPAFILQV